MCGDLDGNVNTIIRTDNSHVQFDYIITHFCNFQTIQLPYCNYSKSVTNVRVVVRKNNLATSFVIGPEF